MLQLGENVVIALQVVGIEDAVTVGPRASVPKARGGGVAAWPQGRGDNLAGAPTQGQPKPNHAPLAMAHKAPQFIHFQGLLGLGGCLRRFQGGATAGLFFYQALTVLRETPKVRLKPRRLLRSS